MRQDAAESLSLDELIQHAHYWLYERRILIPSTRALLSLARSIWAGIERDLLVAIEAVVPLAQRAGAEAAVFAQHATAGTTVLEWLSMTISGSSCAFRHRESPHVRSSSCASGDLRVATPSWTRSR